MTVNKQLTIKGSYDIATPSQMVAMAKVLKNHIVKQDLQVNIKGKNYAYVEGWQFAGGLMGIYPMISSIEDLSSPKEKKWKAEAQLIRLKDDKAIGFGSAICSNLENKKGNT